MNELIENANELIENVEPVIKSFPELKNATDKAMAQAVENFVLIGYLLRKAKDEPELLSGSGYGNYKDFAKSEYGLEESQVSRFISINERYGDGAQLLPQFRGYGQSKLAEMLTLPAAVAEELPTEITRQEIRELKKEIAEENKISELELHVERAENPYVEIWVEFLKDWAHRNPEKFITIDITNEYETLFKDCVLTGRVPGEGKFMLTEKDRIVTLTNLRTNEKKQRGVDELEDILDEINGEGLFTETSWETIFEEKFPRIAPAQESSDKENKPKEEQKANETEHSEEQKTPSDKGNKPITDEESRPIEAETDQDTGMVVADQEAETVDEDIEAEAKEVDEKEEQTIESDENKKENELFVWDLFEYVRNSMDRLEGFLNAGCDAEAKRTIATIIEDLQEMNKAL